MRRKTQAPRTADSSATPKKQPKGDVESKRRGGDFGLEGTNKTIPAPQPGAEPSDELQGTEAKFIPKSPYTRG